MQSQRNNYVLVEYKTLLLHILSCHNIIVCKPSIEPKYF